MLKYKKNFKNRLYLIILPAIILSSFICNTTSELFAYAAEGGEPVYGYVFDYEKFAKDLNFITYAYEPAKLLSTIPNETNTAGNIKTDLFLQGVDFNVYEEYNINGNTYNLPLLSGNSAMMRCDILSSTISYDLVHITAYNDGGDVVSYVGYASNDTVPYINFNGFNSPLHVIKVGFFRTKLTLSDNEIYTIELSPVDLYYGASAFETVKIDEDYVVLGGCGVYASNYTSDVYKKLGYTVGSYFGAVDSLSRGESPITIPSASIFPSEEHYNVFLNYYNTGFTEGKTYYDNVLAPDGEFDYRNSQLFTYYGEYKEIVDEDPGQGGDDIVIDDDADKKVYFDTIDFRNYTTDELYVEKGSQKLIECCLVYANGGRIDKDNNSSDRGLYFHGSGCIEFTLEKASKISITFSESGSRTFYLGEAESIGNGQYDENTYRSYLSTPTEINVSSGVTVKEFDLSAGTHKLSYVGSSSAYISKIEVFSASGGNGGSSDNSGSSGNGGASDSSNSGGNGGASDSSNSGGNGGVSDSSNSGGNGGASNSSNSGGNGGASNSSNSGGNGGASDSSNSGQASNSPNYSDSASASGSASASDSSLQSSQKSSDSGMKDPNTDNNHKHQFNWLDFFQFRCKICGESFWKACEFGIITGVTVVCILGAIWIFVELKQLF